MTDISVVDAVAIIGAWLLTLAAGLMVGTAFGLAAGVGAAFAVLGVLLLAWAIRASQAEEGESR
ncbi:MAG TPA: hypothetical protein VFH63_04015 [candidate division Zixibacteria bacterium]|nr:hypothetical protein [candidate division Zixibacteria bacterium]